VIVSGAKRKAEAEEYDPDSGLIRIAEDEEKAKLEDPFHKVTLVSRYLFHFTTIHSLCLSFSLRRVISQTYRNPQRNERKT